MIQWPSFVNLCKPEICTTIFTISYDKHEYSSITVQILYDMLHVDNTWAQCIYLLGTIKYTQPLFHIHLFHVFVL